MWTRLCAAALAMFLCACAPAIQSEARPQSTPADDALYERLLSAFRPTLAGLNIREQGGQAYRYEGENPDAFLTAINDFYLANPGFCPLEQAFFAADSGVVFMTLAGDGGINVRGFVYDQSKKPNLDYAYFEAQAPRAYPVKPCETAPSGQE